MSGVAAGVPVVVRVDGGLLSTAAAAVPWRVNPGTHRVVVEAAAYQTEERTVELAEGVAQQVDVALRPAVTQIRPEAGRSSPGARSAPAAEPAPYGIVRLHIETKNRAVALFSKGSIQPCIAPCDEVIDARLKRGDMPREFWFGGDGVTKSDSFELYDRIGALTAKVTSGRYAYKVLSILGFSLGGAGILASALGLTLNLAGSRKEDEGLTVGFGLGLGLSTSVLGLSIPLFLGSRTSYELSAPTAGGPGGVK